MKDVAKRGKWAEGEVKKYLDKVKNTEQTFDYIKLKDARSSRGRGASKQVADFQLFTPDYHAGLEVKEVNHAHLLPSKNVTQLPKMHRRSLAGGHEHFIIYFVKTKKWRLVSFSWMWERRHGSSYDFRGVAEFNSVGEVLNLSGGCFETKDTK